VKGRGGEGGRRVGVVWVGFLRGLAFLERGFRGSSRCTKLAKDKQTWGLHLIKHLKA